MEFDNNDLKIIHAIILPYDGLTETGKTEVRFSFNLMVVTKTLRKFVQIIFGRIRNDLYNDTIITL
jgi:hypothetical protein